jgi:hypothetical protein
MVQATRFQSAHTQSLSQPLSKFALACKQQLLPSSTSRRCSESIFIVFHLSHPMIMEASMILLPLVDPWLWVVTFFFNDSEPLGSVLLQAVLLM